MATLDGHENSCCVLGLPNGTVVTGSSGHQQNNQHVDFQLRIWRDGSVVKTMKDHLGPIKDLSLLSDGAGFVSCSNDGTVRVWDIDGNALDCIGGAHTLFEDGARIAGFTVTKQRCSRPSTCRAQQSTPSTTSPGAPHYAPPPG